MKVFRSGRGRRSAVLVAVALQALALLALPRAAVAAEGPVLVPTGATNVTGNTATLNGTFDNKGSSGGGFVNFLWGPSLAYGQFKSVTTQNVSGPQALSVNIGMLTPNTTYHYALSACTVAGCATSSDQTFATNDEGLPEGVVMATGATNVTGNTATLNGTFDNGGIGGGGLVSFLWGTTVSYGQYKTATTQNVSGPQAVSVDIGALTPSTTYHYAVSACTEAGCATSNDQTFTTTSEGLPLPVVVATGASNLTGNTATLNGTFDNRGVPGGGFVNFLWGPTLSYGQFKSVVTQNVPGEQALSVDIGLLNPATTYHYQLSVCTNAGCVQSNDQTFTTTGDALPPPVVVATGATDITETTATLNGTFNNSGSGGAGLVTFLYGTTQSYGQFGSAITQNVPGDQALSLSVGALAPGTTYHYALSACTDAACVTSNDQTFTTASDEPAPHASQFAPLNVSSTAYVGDALSASTVLTDSETANPIGGAPVTFTLHDPAGSTAITATTEDDGTVAATFPLTQRGGHDVTVTYNGDAQHLTASRQADVAVFQRVSLLANAAHGVAGDPTELSAGLQASPSGAGIAGATITFVINEPSGASSTMTATTDNFGVARVHHVSPSAGAGSFTASFDGVGAYYADADGQLAPSSATASMTIAAVSTQVDLDPVGTGSEGGSMAVGATLHRLTTPTGTLAGRLLAFRVTAPSGATSVTTLTTDASGHAGFTVAPLEPGTYVVVVEYAGTQSELASSDGTGFFVVAAPDPAATSLTYAGDTKGVTGKSMDLVATLTSGGAALSGQTVVFTITGPTGTAQVSAVTNAAGRASTTFTPDARGNYTIASSFVGGDLYASSSDSDVADVNGRKVAK